MDPTLLSLLETIPQKPPRSKLETHRELIRQLRRKGCTYRDIVPPERLVFSTVVAPSGAESIVTLLFEARDGHTILRLTIACARKARSSR